MAARVEILQQAGVQGSRTESAAVGGLVELLGHDDPIRRQAAARVMPVNLPTAIQALVAALGDYSVGKETPSDPMAVDRDISYGLMNRSVGEYAAVSLARSGRPMAIEALITSIRHPDRRLSDMASYGLIAGRNSELRDRLISALGDPWARVRSVALQSLAYLDDEAALPEAQRLRSDPVAAVRLAAQKTLDRIDQQRKAEEWDWVHGAQYFMGPDYGHIFLKEYLNRATGADDGRQRRYLNTQLNTASGVAPIPTDRNLVPGERYILQLHIGPPSALSAVINPDENPFPDHIAYGEVLDLDIFTISNDFDVEPGPHTLRLPPDGSKRRTAY